MKNQAHIALIVIVILLLSASIGILHGRKKMVDPQVVSDDTRIILERQDAIDYVQPSLISGNMEMAAAMLHHFDAPLLLKVLDTILKNETVSLSDEQKIQLLTAALLYEKNTQKQAVILDRLYHYFSGYPIFIGMVPRYIQAIPLIMTWLETINDKKQREQWIQQSFNAALEKDDVELFTGLYAAGIQPDAKEASPLLYRVVSEGKKPAFIPFLVQQMKADINYSPDDRYTPLIRAVEQNNVAMVKALVAHGANPEQILDPKVGNARQIAFEKGYTPIELVLKKYR